jgi:hypothetical protein
VWLVLGVAMMLPPAAAAQQRTPTPTPSARELWKSYPLQPGAQEPGPTEERAQLASPTPSAHRKAVHTAPLESPRPSSGGGAPVALLGIAGALGALGAFLVLRRRRAPRAGVAMPLFAATATAAALSERPRQARLTTLAGAGGNGRERTEEEDGWRAQDLRPPDPTLPWTAELEWHGDGEGPRFCVTARPVAGGPEALIALSEPIEWPPADPAAVERLRRSVARIEAAVRSAGWAPAAPGEAWYSKRFAWTPVATRAPARTPAPTPTPTPTPSREPTPAAEPAAAPPRGLFDPPPTWPQGTEELWRCEIRWRAGYINSRFAAVARRPGQRGTTTVGSSETFKWMIMADPEPPTPELLDAVAQLDEQVTALGWEPAGFGREWWERRYLWRGEGRPPLDLERSPARAGGGIRGDDG